MQSAAVLGPNKALRYDAVRTALRRTDVWPRRILEIGCGQGAMGAHLSEMGEYLGLEPDLPSFELAQDLMRRIGRGEVRNIGFESLDASEKFDLVCAFEVLEHMPDDDLTLEQWTALVAPDGLLLVSTPGYEARYTAYDKLVGHCRRYQPDFLAGLLSKHGLEDVSVLHYGYPFYNFTEFAYRYVAEHRLRKGDAPDSQQERTAASGRMSVVPRPLARVAALLGEPFRLAQKLFPDRGPGLLAFGRKPI
jgi:SAM-dependent methyltransferase